MEPNIYENIGKRVREYRIKLGLTQEELADKSNIHYSFLGHIERGSKKASLETISKIADALSVPLYRLFEFITPVINSKKSKFSGQIDFLIKDHSPEYQRFVVDVVRKLAKGWNLKSKKNRKK